ncbi:hypothetical protein BGZ65_009020, partial [Modicella reniformis]
MAIHPKQTAVVGTDDYPSTVASSVATITTSGLGGTITGSSTGGGGGGEASRQQQQQGGGGLKITSPTTMQPSPAVELVSKFLTGGGASAGAGNTISAAHSAEDHHHPHHHNLHHHHTIHGSPTANKRQVGGRGGYDRSNATSPQQRPGFTSKFYPASPSQPQLSSSAPKAITTSNTLIPPTIVTTMSSDDPFSESLSGGGQGGGHTPLTPSSAVSPASAIAAAAVAQSNLSGNGSKTGTLSRTQQKLWLQRDNLQDVDGDEMARRKRVQKDMDRINREYK